VGLTANPDEVPNIKIPVRVGNYGTDFKVGWWDTFETNYELNSEEQIHINVAHFF
jgi:hypothetical protein